MSHMNHAKRDRKSGRVVLCLLALWLLSTALFAADYYTEPQIYGNRPNPGGEYDLGPIGVSGIMARIYKGVAVTVEETQPNTPQLT